jgi:cytochrome c
MKIIVVIAGICFFILMADKKAVSENNSAIIQKISTDTVPAPAKKAFDADTTVIIPDSAAIREGLALIGRSDCTTCHRIEENSIGPSYKAIADRYKATKANIELLAQRTIKGGHGIWSRVPMTPHPDLPVEEARKMVRFIFSLTPVSANPGK